MNRIFIAGTDTEIGKTLISMLITKTLVEMGKDVEYYKPFQTGCKNEFDTNSDAKFVFQNIDKFKDKNIADSIGVIFENPKAPLFAARNEGKIVDLDIVEKSMPKAAINILEGAGGLMVPLTSDTLTIDWLSTINPKVILVARAGLGTINHTLLSLNLLKQKKVTVIGVILSNPQNTTNREMISENIEAIEEFGNTEVIGTVNDYNCYKKEELDKIMLRICNIILDKI